MKNEFYKSVLKLLNKHVYLSFIFFFLSVLVSFSSAQSVHINEFMALNSTTIMDEDGDYSDWIELYNDSSVAINLNNWSLTDDPDNKQKWIFPDIILESYQFLIVFASGKDRSTADQELHTDFKLSGDGEYFALFNSAGNAVTEFDPTFPPQLQDISYGYFDGEYLASTSPTPGEENLLSEHQILQVPELSHTHGIYDAPFNLEITTDLLSAQIYYTTNGNTPNSSNGYLYTGPILINSTTVIRAIIIKPDSLRSKVVTSTFLFLADVINQPNDPEGYPSEWGPYIELDGNAIADYEMDTEITQNPEYADLMEDALRSIPTMSIVTDISNLFSHSTDPDSGGIYIYTGPADEGGTELGDGWERPASAEFFNSGGAENFQINCGLRIHGGHSKRPEKTPKHSFRLAFRSEYGASKLNYPLLKECETSSFNTLVLRAGYGNNWLNRISERRDRAQLIRDIWAKDTQLDMGHPSAHGTFVHLYLNGIYWGIYNPTERIDDDFAVTYFGGNEEDYDILKDYNQIAAGDAVAWNAMMSIANGGLENNENYQLIQGKNPDGTYNPDYEPYVDIINFIDYMVINFYSGNWDWDAHNWVAVRNRVNPGKGFKFFSWDAEQILEQLDENRLGTNSSNRPTHLFQQLRENPDFLRLFADRINLHLFNDGVLSPGVAADQWMQRANEIDLAIIAESARWGDYRRDVHQFFTSGPFDLYDKTYWLSQQSFLMDEYFPNRGDIFIQQLRDAGLFPDAVAPTFFINGESITGNIINVGDTLSMSAPTGIIYYTTDGSDPVIPSTPDGVAQYQLITESQSKTAIIPLSDIGNSWRSDIGFNDSGWLPCDGSPGGIGYEKTSGYQDFISLDVIEMADGAIPNTTCYVRILFNIDGDILDDIKDLELNVLYDDGFIAYLNRQKIAEIYAPVLPTWNSEASGSHEAANFEVFNISQYIGDLVEGDNLLAIHGLNYRLSSSDFIINAELIGSNQASSGGSLSPGAVEYLEPIELTQSTYIKARTQQGNEWSALSEKIFSIPGDISNLKTTEIHYHPLAEGLIDDQEFEFIELKNTGASPLDLSGFNFNDGISYTFPMRTVLNVYEFIVLASNQSQFTDRYGFYAFDEDEGNLNNGGEQIIGVSSAGDTIINILFDDIAPWPLNADGQGYSLVPKDSNPQSDQNDPDDWRASLDIHGSPGRNDEPNTAVDDEPGYQVINFNLAQNYPNPFNPSTTIYYSIQEYDFVTMKIYNVLGQEVKTLVNKFQEAGQYRLIFRADNLASGVYFYSLITEKGHKEIKKMLLIR